MKLRGGSVYPLLGKGLNTVENYMSAAQNGTNNNIIN